MHDVRGKVIAWPIDRSIAATDGAFKDLSCSLREIDGSLRFRGTSRAPGIPRGPVVVRRLSLGVVNSEPPFDSRWEAARCVT